jgi:hypothetical protein
LIGQLDIEGIIMSLRYSIDASDGATIKVLEGELSLIVAVAKCWAASLIYGLAAISQFIKEALR